MKGGFNVLSHRFVHLIQYLPKGMVVFISKNIAGRYINKYANIELTGKENLQSIQKPIIFICNHLSNSDGLILNKVLKKQDLTFVAGVKLTNDPVTNLGMNIVKTIRIKPNSADKDALTKVIKTIKEGNNVIIFPEGTRSRTGNMIEGKKGVLLIAKITKAIIIPIGLSGTEKLLPINEKGNMSSENFNYAEVKVNIGKPVHLVEKDPEEDRHLYDDRALKDLMRNIALLLPEEQRGVYK